jgi:hypothetical protein
MDEVTGWGIIMVDQLTICMVTNTIEYENIIRLVGNILIYLWLTSSTRHTPKKITNLYLNLNSITPWLFNIAMV